MQYHIITIGLNLRGSFTSLQSIISQRWLDFGHIRTNPCKTSLTLQLQMDCTFIILYLKIFFLGRRRFAFKKKQPTIIWIHHLSFTLAKSVARKQKLDGWAMLVIVWHLQKYEIHAELHILATETGRSLLIVCGLS